MALVVVMTWAVSAGAQPKRDACDRPGGCPNPTRRADGSCVCPDDAGPAKVAEGTVKSASADTIVVKGKAHDKDTEWTFAVDSKTSIQKTGKAVTSPQLRPGESVKVKYREREGKAKAESITVGASPKTDGKKAGTK
jgi:hypothetical protein